MLDLQSREGFFMKVTIAATQMACNWDLKNNIDKAISMVHQAADLGAQIILLQELFETPYFCIDTQNEHFNLAKTLSEQPTIKKMFILCVYTKIWSFKRSWCCLTSLFF